MRGVKESGKRKISIVQYMLICVSAILLIVMAFLIVLMSYTTSRAVKSEAFRELRRLQREVHNSLEIVNGIPVIGDDLEIEDEEFYFVVLDEAGNYLSGTYPDDLDVDSIRLNTEYKCRGSSFIIMDYKHNRAKKFNNNNYIIRGIVRLNDFDSDYKKTMRFSYISIAVVLLLLIGFAWLLQKKLAKPINGIRLAAKRISTDCDFSEKMDYGGMFVELNDLVEANNHLLDKMNKEIRKQEQFNSDVAHELRTPIAVISAQCELLKETQNCSEADYKDAMEIIDRQTSKMQKMVEQLLSLSRFEQNKDNLRFESIQLVPMIESVCEDVDIYTEGKYEFVYELENVAATADLNLLTLAIRNLISNATKYSNPGSKIKVECGTVGDRCFISVEDNGIGISKENISRIFDNYYRVDEARNKEGFGLGLALVKKVVECHGGEVTVQSEIEKGSKFTIFIPK